MILEDDKYIVDNAMPHLRTQVWLYRKEANGRFVPDGLAYPAGDTWAVRVRAAVGFPVVERNIASKRGAVLALWHHRKLTPSYDD